MNGKEYQVKAMRTNDGLGIERIMNMADNLEQGVEDNVPDAGIDLGGIINGLLLRSKRRLTRKRESLFLCTRP